MNCHCILGSSCEISRIWCWGGWMGECQESSPRALNSSWVFWMSECCSRGSCSLFSGMSFNNKYNPFFLVVKFIFSETSTSGNQWTCCILWCTCRRNPKENAWYKGLQVSLPDPIWSWSNWGNYYLNKDVSATLFFFTCISSYWSTVHGDLIGSYSSLSDCLCQCQEKVNLRSLCRRPANWSQDFAYISFADLPESDTGHHDTQDCKELHFDLVTDDHIFNKFSFRWSYAGNIMTWVQLTTMMQLNRW